MNGECNMTIKVTKTLNLTPAKVAEILAAAYAKKQGIDPSGVKISFSATTSYDQFDRGPGSPTFTGATVTIEDSEEFEI
jgi:hypothetical protein